MDVKKSKMREIVDRHFYDSWVIPFYLSYYVDLTIEWNEFKAARKALENTLDLDYI
jgi:WASH complex subunit strumpellin